MGCPSCLAALGREFQTGGQFFCSTLYVSWSKGLKNCKINKTFSLRYFNHPYCRPYKRFGLFSNFSALCSEVCASMIARSSVRRRHSVVTGNSSLASMVLPDETRRRRRCRRRHCIFCLCSSRLLPDSLRLTPSFDEMWREEHWIFVTSNQSRPIFLVI